MENLRPLAARPALNEDIDEVVRIIRDISLWLRTKNVIQWSDSFPRQILESEVSRGELFVFGDKNGIIASVALATEADELWDHVSENAIYLHRLVIVRRRAGERLGEAMMAWAEAEAKSKGANFLRLVCDESNPFLPNYYLRLGYEPKGIKLYEPWKMSFARFEKVL